MNPNPYLVRGGIASLACAAYLIRDGGIPGRNKGAAQIAAKI
jgi:myosin-crossreactive antigen